MLSGPIRAPQGPVVDATGRGVLSAFEPLVRLGARLLDAPVVAVYAIDGEDAELVGAAGPADVLRGLLPVDRADRLAVAEPTELTRQDGEPPPLPLQAGRFDAAAALAVPAWTSGGDLAAVAFFVDERPRPDLEVERLPDALHDWLRTLALVCSTSFGPGTSGVVDSPRGSSPSSEGALDALLGSRAIAVVLLDPAGRVDRLNGPAQARWGRDLDVGAELASLASPALGTAIQSMLDIGAGAGPVELQERDQGGVSLRRWRTVLEAVPDANGGLAGLLVVAIQWGDSSHVGPPPSVLAPEIDELTGLPNRALAERRLDRDVTQAEKRGEGLAIVMLALDRFKRVNDSLGHARGDALLRQVAERLATNVIDGDTVARIGGDEFLVIFTGTGSDRAPLALADRLLQSVQEPFHVDGNELVVSASLGLACYPDDGVSGAALRQCADIALHRAKEQGRGRLQRFDRTMQNSAEDRLRIEREIRRALQDRHFVLHYQPKYSLDDGRMTGSEALLRWFHPDRGVVYPGQFIGVAEETRLIVPLGAWSLVEACRQQRIWRDLGLEIGPVSVNVAAPQFARRDFVESVERALASSGLPPAGLELEVTESMLMDDVHAAADRLSALRDLGVRVSVDDFGTGYSSLAYLQRLPVDVLKIDRTFVKDLDADTLQAEQARVLAQAITGLGHSLGLRVIAEGVETVEQLDELLEIGCDEAQGFLFARPMPSDEVVDDGKHEIVGKRRAELASSR